MEELQENMLRHAVGMADVTALMAEAFTFPGENAIESGLETGSFASDWHASWEDALFLDALASAEGEEFPDPLTPEVEEALGQANGAKLTIEFSRLFYTPGVNAPVWMYESAFLHREAELPENPILFRTNTTVDVERQMEEAGVRPVNLRREPCDSCAMELNFLSYLYGRYGELLGDEATTTEALQQVKDQIKRFVQSHLLKWLPRFFAQVEEKTEVSTYKALAILGQAYMKLLATAVDATE